MVKFILKALIVTACIFPISDLFAQNMSTEMNALVASQKEQFESSELSAINQKIPLFPKQVTLSQLADTSKPNKEQKLQLEKFSKLRSDTVEKGNQIIQNYMKPQGFALGLIVLRREAETKYGAALADLYNSKITFGDFNKKRSEVNDDFLAKQAKLTADIKSGSNPTQTASSNSAGTVLATFTDNSADAVVYLYDQPCNVTNLQGSYPWRWTAFAKNTTSEKGVGCYSIVQSSKQLMLASTNGNVVPLRANELDGQRQSTASAVGDAFGMFMDGLKNASEIANRPSQFSPSTNCTTRFNGNNAQTNCH